jgi:hypothetical protein
MMNDQTGGILAKYRFSNLVAYRLVPEICRHSSFKISLLRNRFP